MYFENRRVVRNYELFDNQVVCKVLIDKVEVLQIVVDTANLQFATPLCDCTLDVLANESKILVNLVSSLNSGDC